MSLQSYCTIRIEITTLPTRNLDLAATDCVEIRTCDDQTFPGIIGAEDIGATTQWVLQVLDISSDAVTVRINPKMYRNAPESLRIERESKREFTGRTQSTTLTLSLLNSVIR